MLNQIVELKREIQTCHQMRQDFKAARLILPGHDFIMNKELDHDNRTIWLE